MTRLGRTVGVVKARWHRAPRDWSISLQSMRGMKGLGVHSTGQKSEVKKSPERGARVSGVREGCKLACRSCLRSTLGVVR